MCTAISSSQISPCICTLLEHTKQICSINRAIWLMRPIHPTRFNLWQCNHSLLLDWQLRFTIWITRVLQCVSSFTKTNFSDKHHHDHPQSHYHQIGYSFSSHYTSQCLHQFIQTIQIALGVASRGTSPPTIFGCFLAHKLLTYLQLFNSLGGTSLPTIEVWSSFQRAPLWALCRSQLSNLVLISSLQVLLKTANHFKVFSSSPS